MRLRIICVLFSLPIILAGCVGSPIHSTITYSSIQSTIKKNNLSLAKFQTGMSQDEVRALVGEPERSEGYQWGSAWLYRTAMTNGTFGGIYGSVDADFTPVMFDENRTLIGWGRNFYEQRLNKHELTILNKVMVPK